MTDVKDEAAVDTLPEGYRIVPTLPTYAVSKDGGVLNLSRGQMHAMPWEDSDGEMKIIAYILDDETGKARRSAIKVSAMVQSAFPVGVKSETEHGGNNHVSSPSCGMCYLGFEASPAFTRQMVWFMALKLADEVDATPSQLVDEVREELEAYNAREEAKSVSER
jgi:hypothetical protein